MSTQKTISSDINTSNKEKSSTSITEEEIGLLPIILGLFGFLGLLITLIILFS